MFTQLVVNERAHHAEFAFSELAAERRHTVAAIGDLVIYLVFGFELEFAGAKARDLFSVIQLFAFAFRPVTNCTVLTKEG